MTMILSGCRWRGLIGGCLAIGFCTAVDAAPPKAAAPTNSIAIPKEEPLWPDGAPGSKGAKDNEKTVNRAKDGLDRSVSNVHKPTLSAHLPPKATATGTAVVICPGGGYGRVVIDKEGHDIARWLNSIGIAAFVLKYRSPRPDGFVYGNTAPLQDAQRAIRLVRSRATQWNVKPNQIGVMGFSAGGHLASTAGTHFDSGTKDAADPLDRLSCRPDFQLLIYPVISMLPDITHTGSRRNLLGNEPDDKLVQLYSNELQVTPETPPAFLVHTNDDGVKADNSVRFFMACRKAKVPAELHLYEKGGHGYGIRKTGTTVENWPQQCQAWLKARGLLKSTP